VPEELREDAHRFEQALRKGFVALDLGRAEEARVIAAELLADEAAERLPAKRSEALLLEAEALDGSGRTEEAIARARDALSASIAADAPDIATKAAASLVWSHGNVRNELERAEDFAFLGFAWLGRAREPADPSYMLTSYLGSAYQVAGRIEEAIEHHERALALASESYGGRSLQYAKSLVNLGNALSRSDLERAETTYVEAREIFVERVGELHPGTLRIDGNLALLSVTRRRFDEAIGRFRRVVEGQRRVLGPGHPWMAANLANLGDALHLAGRSEEAVPVLRDAIAILEASDGPSAASTIIAEIALSRALTKQKEYQAALDTLARTREKAEGSYLACRPCGMLCALHA
jgi:tetratricopeptide (TPR) repeat protein